MFDVFTIAEKLMHLEVQARERGYVHTAAELTKLRARIAARAEVWNISPQDPDDRALLKAIPIRVMSDQERE